MAKSSKFPYKFGWIPDVPDARDYTPDTPAVKSLLVKKPSSLPSKTDLREWCSPVFNQGDIGSCTANAAAGMVEYYRKRALGKEGAVSRLFIYKATRDLMQTKGDSGGYIRTTMGSLALFGCPPEKYWDYEENIDKAPPAFCYSYALNYQAITYFRLDEKAVGIPSKEKDATLLEVKSTLASFMPAMFGFTVYESIRGAQGGRIPYPARGESVLGGHAVLAVGYDDSMKIGSCTGAFIIRNSWGDEWGENGYGYLPYEYLLSGIAQDWWALAKAEWMDVEGFGV